MTSDAPILAGQVAHDQILAGEDGRHRDHHRNQGELPAGLLAVSDEGGVADDEPDADGREADLVVREDHRTEPQQGAEHAAAQGEHDPAPEAAARGLDGDLGRVGRLGRRHGRTGVRPRGHALREPRPDVLSAGRAVALPLDGLEAGRAQGPVAPRASRLRLDVEVRGAVHRTLLADVPWRRLVDAEETVPDGAPGWQRADHAFTPSTPLRGFLLVVDAVRRVRFGGFGKVRQP
jgi:hypothetical protein